MKIHKKNLLIIPFLIIMIGTWLLWPHSAPEATWYNDGWAFRKKLTIDPAKVAGSSDLANFPVLVTRTSDTDLSAHAQSDGDDILFTDVHGSKLDHEIESYSAGTLVAWVRIPTLYTSENTVIYMYYGNATANNQSQVEDVWDSNYKGVWHLREATAATRQDSTKNINNLFDTASVTSVTGKIGQGVDYEASSSQWNSIGDGTQVGLDITGPLTIETWFQTESAATTQTILGKDGPSGDNGYLLRYNSTGKVNLLLSGDGTAQTNLANNTSLSTATWYHVTAVYDGTNMAIYLDGTYDGSTAYTSGIFDSTNKFSIGVRATTTNPMDGLIDEARVSNVARSPEWVKTSYDNQSSPSTFFSAVGSEEGTPGPIAFWKFDEGANNTCSGGANDACDTTQQQNDLALSGASWKAEDLCANGKCLQFDGTNDSLSRTDDADLDFDASDSFTVSGWFRHAPNATDTETIFAKEGSVGLGTGSTATTTITTSSDEGTGGDDASWRKRVVYDANNDRWHVIYIDSQSDIHSQSTAASSGTSYTDGADIVAGTYDYDDFSCVSETDNGSATYLHCALSDSATHVLNYVRCSLSGSAPYIACDGTQVAYTAVDGSDDVAYPAIATDINDCGYIAADVEDDSLATADEHQVYLWKEATPCGDGTWATAQTIADLPTEAGYNADLPVGIEMFNDGTGTGAQLFWLDTDSGTSTDLESVYFDGTALGTQRTLNADVEYIADSVNYWSVNTGTIMRTFGAVDTQLFLSQFSTIAKDGTAAPTPLGIGLSSPVDTSGQSQMITAITDTIASGADDLWAFATDDADDADIYYNTSTNGGTSWGTRTQWINSFDGTEAKYLSAVYNTENCDIMVSWLGKATTPWNVNSKIINTGSCTGPATKGYKVQMESDGDLTFTLTDGTGTDAATSTAATYDDNQWHYFSAVKDGTSSLTLYIDGNKIAQDTSIAATGSLANSGNVSIGIGSDGTTNPYDGFLDDIKVYRYARSQDQIKTDAVRGAAKKGSQAVVLGSNDFLTKGLVGYWKLDENTGTTTLDSSGNLGTSSTFAGNATWGVGKYGSGISFDGTDDVVRIPEKTATDLGATTDSYTVSAWFKTTVNSPTTSVILTKSGSASTNPYALILDSSERVAFLISTGSSISAFTSASYNDGRWHHAVGVRDVVTDKIYLYVDGQLVHFITDTTTATMANNDDIALGNGGNSTYTASDFGGQIDDVRIYSRALEPQEIEKLYNWAPGPVGYWNLDENTGLTAYDKSGNGNNGTLSAFQPTKPTWTTGKFGAAVNFDGTNNQYITVADPGTSVLDLTGPMTIGFWVRGNSAGNSAIDQLISKADGAIGAYSYLLQLNSSNKLEFKLSSSGSSEDSTLTSNTTFTRNSQTWYYLSTVFDGSSTFIYVNGVLDNTGTHSGSIASANAAFCMGCEYIVTTVSATLDGILDDVRVYNYARTPGQIIEDMNGGHPVGGSPIGSQAGYWKFDDGTSTTAQDSSPNNNDMTLSTATSAWTNSGKFGKAWDGNASRYVSRADDADFDFLASEDFTLSTWIKSDGTATGVQYILNKASSSAQWQSRCQS